MTQMIPVYKPLLGDAEKQAAIAALDLGWLGLGSLVGKFEQDLISFLDAQERHVVALSTGHAALHLALLLIGAGPGDEIITPSFNNISDLQAIAATGASPVFVDIDEQTLCIDLDAVERSISSSTKAIIVMDYACHLCDHDRVSHIASRHGIRIIHDAAHSFGSLYKGRKIGTFSDLCMFSFDPVKTITAIDGGALLVKSEEEVQVLQEMRLVGTKQSSKVMYGNQRSWGNDVERLGFRYHLANMHAAIGSAQLGQFDHISKSRKDSYNFYIEQLSGISGLHLPNQDITEIVPFMFYVRVMNCRRSALMSYLKERGVETGVHWQPAHTFSFFKDCRKGDLSVTERIASEVLSLPFHSGMSESDRKQVTTAIQSFFKS